MMLKKLFSVLEKLIMIYLMNVKKNKLDSQIAIVRIEQLCPFPFDLIRTELEKYKNAKICFAQEEHKNMGPVSLLFLCHKLF